MTYKEIVCSYIQEVRPCAQEELDCFRKLPSLIAALEKAAYAINEEGKRFAHQYRRRRVALETARQVLLDNVHLIERVNSFDELHALFEGILTPIHDIGELYIYDTALRVGAKLGLLPDKVYLHAGTRVGANALGFDRKAKTLEVSMLPQEFHNLKAHEIEDVLCIYKSSLNGAESKCFRKCMGKRKRSC